MGAHPDHALHKAFHTWRTRAKRAEARVKELEEHLMHKGYQNFTPREREASEQQRQQDLTCEQRRAIEYGIDEPPNGKDYPDPIVFALDYNEWERRSNERGRCERARSAGH